MRLSEAEFPAPALDFNPVFSRSGTIFRVAGVAGSHFGKNESKARMNKTQLSMLRRTALLRYPQKQFSLR